MRKRTAIGIAGLVACVMAGPSLVSATSVKHMNLDALTNGADKIFRGTVTSAQPGTVRAGGADLPTLTYTIKVSEALKGDFTIVKGDQRYARITMIGGTKADPRNSVRKFDFFRDVPRLKVGGEYLLFTSAKSSIGLSTTIGLGQGCFDISGSTALNRAGNLGLFQGAATPGPAKGPLAYDDLANRVRAILAAQ